MRYSACNATLLLVFLSSTAWPVQIDQVSVVKKGKNFLTEAVFMVEAPRERVVRAMTDFDQLSELNPAIVSSKAEVQSSGGTRVTTKMRDCVSFFCRSVALVEDVHFDEAGSLRSEVVPRLSDFASGHAVWRFEAVGTRTRVHFRSQVRPKFWMPPLLGSSAFRHLLRRQIGVAADSIEARANKALVFADRPTD